MTTNFSIRHYYQCYDCQLNLGNPIDVSAQRLFVTLRITSMVLKRLDVNNDNAVLRQIKVCSMESKHKHMYLVP